MKHTLILALSFLLVGACGDKAKKKKTTATTVPDESSGSDSAEGNGPDSSSENTAAAELKDVVYFGFDQADLDDAARDNLQKNADWMAEEASRVLTIEGHTDESGTSDYNLALGEKRARVTKEYLVRLGVDAPRIQIITYGEERPASSTEDSLNRRSVFVATRK